MSRGYFKEVDPHLYEYVTENVLVGCKRCYNQWYEEREMFKLGIRINSALQIYDYCDKCITEEEKLKCQP